ncbi:MAG TPA: hypothetical protein VHO50_12120 [Bacteroidales bacterium]|nr:hypothetical protein [Bacteroidales bacterium]
MLKIFSIALLLMISLQDLKNREIDWFLFPLLLICFIIQGFLEMEPVLFLKTCGLNLVFIISQFLFLLFFLRLKGYQIKYVISTLFGIGDILFLIIVAFPFSNMNFLVFYFSGLIFSLAIFLLYKYLISPRIRLIPLAGLLSLYLALIVISDIFFEQFRISSDNYLMKLLYG